MERVDLELGEFTHRAGSVLVAHSGTGLGRGLEPDEKVLVRDDGRHWVATVRDISFDLTDTHYRLELGAEVDPIEARLLLSEGPRTGGSPAVALSDVLDLLREAHALGAEGTRLPGALLR